jgi:uncharacterized protein
MTPRAAPALIVFCREAAAGTVKTRLARRIGADATAALAHAFTVDALAKGRSLCPARLIIAGAPATDVSRARPYFARLAARFDAEVIWQGNGSLGSRMARVLGAFVDGAGALLIGTDTPSLPRAIVARGLEMLRRRRVVVAPSLDGGYYALGVRGALPPIFTGLRWGGSRVYAGTVARLRRAQIPYAVAPAWYDVDRWPDLLLLAAHLERIACARPPAAAHPCPATAAVMRRLGLLDSGR